MDAFYASVEQRDHPEWRGKPIAVGGSKERGVVAAASYEARQYGIHSAMASSIAYRRCPQIIFVKPDFEKYRAVSEQIREIFFSYTPLVEPLSLDEAYLDVTENLVGLPTATKIARAIRADINRETGLTASAGISINKFLAKVASDLNKPNGQKTILPEEALDFLEKLPIGKFYGIGEKTAAKMKKLGIHSGADLKAWDQYLLIREFGKSGASYYRIVRAIQPSEVKPHRIRKSIGVERTFGEDLKNEADQAKALSELGRKLQERWRKHPRHIKTITLKVKFSDFRIRSHSRTLELYTDQFKQVMNVGHELLTEAAISEPVRLLGLSLSNFKPENDDSGRQLTLDF